MHSISDISIIENTVIKLSGYSVQLQEGENMRKCIKSNFSKRGILSTTGEKLTIRNLLLSNLMFKDSIS